MADANEVIFKRLDEHLNQITDLKIRAGAIERIQEQHSIQFQQMAESAAKMQTEILTKIKSVADEVGTLMKDHYRHQGAEEEKAKLELQKEKRDKRFQWGVGVALTLMTIMITLLTANGMLG